VLSGVLEEYEGAAIGDQEDRDVDLQMTMVRGDSLNLLVAVKDFSTDPEVAVDLSEATDGTAARPAVVRFSVKERPDDDLNSEAIVYRTSYTPSGIEVLDQSIAANLGKFLVKVDKEDTEEDGDPELQYRWDIEVSLQGELRTDAGTVTLVAGSKIVTGVGTAFLSTVRKGDIFQPLDVNDIPAIVTKVVSDTVLWVEFTGWSDESGLDYEIRRGEHITVRRGPFTILSGVVAE
jgi:hypothetical protein